MKTDPYARYRYMLQHAATSPAVLDAMIRDEHVLVLKCSPTTGWWIDMMVYDEDEPEGMTPEAWDAAETNIAYYAAWLDSYMVRAGQQRMRAVFEQVRA